MEEVRLERLVSDPRPSGKIVGLHCAGCVRTVETALLRLPGVTLARLDLATGRLHLEGTPSEGAVARAVEAAGYAFEEGA